MTTTYKQNIDDFYKDLENGNWENKPKIVLNPHKRKETKKYFVKLSFAAIFFGVLFLWVSDFTKYDLAQAQHQLNNDTIKPEMQKLADSGKTSAILWMASNYPKTEQQRLDPLIAQKNPDALLLKAQLLYKTDQDLSLKYLNAAAQEGNATAVKALSEKNPMDIGFTKFFTEYLIK